VKTMEEFKMKKVLGDPQRHPIVELPLLRKVE
jgi:hypothetical protein